MHHTSLAEVNQSNRLENNVKLRNNLFTFSTIMGGDYETLMGWHLSTFT